ncbi:Calx-beta domain-containing protein [Rubrivirga sp.]|uniref:Calx-beta domain-containing protein n=1 Tax=Rubrivirga sp. TaxID=1885344 RepID=UPI003B51A31A
MSRFATLALLLIAAPALAQPTVSLSASPTTITEANGTSTLTLTLSATAATNTTVTLNAAGDGDAYTLASSTVTIPAGQTTSTTTLQAKQDNDFDDETVVVSITSVSGGGGATENGNQTATITITDDDIPTVRLAVSPSTITEGQTSTITASLPFGATADGAITVALGYSGGSGRFTAPGQLIIPDGANSGTVTFTSTDNTTNDGNATVTVTIDGVAGDGTEDGNQSKTITIQDNDAPLATVSLTTNRTSVAENGGTATLTVRLSKSVTQPTTVTIGATGDGDAYTLAPTTLTIPAGQREATATLTGVNDPDFDSDVIRVSIDAVTGGDGAIENGNQFVDIIVTDDDTPAVTLSASPLSIAEGDSTTVTAALPAGVNASADITVRLTYEYDDDDGEDDPTNGAGEFGAPDRIVIKQGANSGSIRLGATDDTDDELNGTLTVSVASVTGPGKEDTDQEVEISIVDNDNAPGVTFDAVPRVIAESGGTSALTVTLTNKSDRVVKVALSYFGSASRGNDYTAPDTVFVQPGQLTGSAPLTSIGGDDNNEQIIIQVETVVNGTETGDQLAFVTLNPDLNQATASFVETTLEADEDDGSVTLRLRLSEAFATAKTVRVTLDADSSSGTSADLGGFSSQTVTFAANATTASLSIPISNDGLLEDDETFVFRITSTDAEIRADAAVATLTVTDDDTETALVINEFDSITGAGDSEFVELFSAGGGGLADGLAIAFYDTDSTAVSVSDLDGFETDDDGYLVLRDVDAGVSIPDQFLGVALFRGNGPAVGSLFNPASPSLVDAVFQDEAAAAAERGRLAREGSLQRQDTGSYAFVAPPTPGEENGIGAAVSTVDGPVTEPVVGDVFPNPSAGRSAVEFAVPTAQHVRVAVFDALGREVALAYDAPAPSGAAVRVALSGRSLAPGVYVVRVTGETFAETRTLTVSR